MAAKTKGKLTKGTTILRNQVFNVTKATTPSIPGGLKITAEIEIDRGWYTSMVELYALQSGQKTPLGPMFYESTDAGTGHEFWAGMAYESGGGPPITYIVEADLTATMSERVAGAV